MEPIEPIDPLEPDAMGQSNQTVSPALLESKSKYFEVTKTVRFSFLASVPLLLLYELIMLAGSNNPAGQVRVGSEVWIKQFLSLLGYSGTLVLGAVILIVGSIMFYRSRNTPLGLKKSFVPLFLAESTVYAVVVAFFVSTVVSFAMIWGVGTAAPRGLLTDIGLSIGAGLYEELLFRVILVGGIFWGLSKVLKTKRSAYIYAAVVGALAFSAVHYIGSLGDAFTLSSFTFRFLFGLALNAIFLVRGFGVAAWTHAIYDILIVTGILG